MNTLIQADKNHMKTLISCLNMLEKLGFTTQFQVSADGLKSLTTSRVYRPEEVSIVNFYRFEGDSNPDENAILYAIETNNGERGSLTDVYGPGNDVDVSAFISMVETIKKKVNKDEQLTNE